jgi:chromosome segregation ATPase
MSESAWLLWGVDPEARQKAAAEAAARGLSLADYLEDVLRQGIGEGGAPAALPSADTALRADASSSHNLKTLERRLTLAIGRLDSTASALDNSFLGLAARIDVAESMAAETSDALNSAMSEVDANLSALKARLGETEAAAQVLGDEQHLAYVAFDARLVASERQLTHTESRARGAEQGVSELAAAHEALKRAVAQDFNELARQTDSRLTAGLAELRAAADAAAEQAEAASAHLVSEMRALRNAVEARVTESAAETRKRMQAAMAEGAAKITNLSTRIDEQERAQAAVQDFAKSLVADSEERTQATLEATAETLRQAGAALAAEFARATRENESAIEAVHADLSAEIAQVREHHAGATARQKQIDAALASAAEETQKLRGETNAGFTAAESLMRVTVARAQSDWDERFAALSARLTDNRQATQEDVLAARAETTRVEASMLAALEKLAGDIIKLRDDSGGAESRFAAIDGALAGTHAGAAQLARRVTQLETSAAERRYEERLQHVESALENGPSDQAVTALREQTAAVAAGLTAARRMDESLAKRLDDIQRRLAAAEQSEADAAENLGKFSAALDTTSEAGSSHNEERLSEIEFAAERLREVAQDQAEALASVEARIAAWEERQADAFEVLRDGLAQFISENERRFAALEAGSTLDEAIAGEIDAMRARVEARVGEIEQRSVRALEQVADTMAILEERFMQARDDQARTA